MTLENMKHLAIEGFRDFDVVDGSSLIMLRILLQFVICLLLLRSDWLRFGKNVFLVLFFHVAFALF